jgi:guanosine-3',5'-bis(diphosphate) 3'-pyrophosphohydrolase
MIKLEKDNNWFLNISDTKLSRRNIRTPLYLTEYLEYIKYMTKEGKYENSKGVNEFYLSQIEIDTNSWIFGLQNNPEEDDLENLEDYLSHIRRLKFQSHESWGKLYTKSEIIQILAQHKMWYITEADFMKSFYKQYGYDGFVTEENAGYEEPFENLCILNRDKIISVENIYLSKKLKDELDLNKSVISDYIKSKQNKLKELEDKKSIAKNFVKDSHNKLEQKRNFTGEEFWKHPHGVSDLLEGYGINNEDILIIALCHDLLEDTDTTLNDLEKMFGSKIAETVSELTNDKHELNALGRKYLKQGLSREDAKLKAKTFYIDKKLLNLSSDALTVKLGDMYYNIKDHPTSNQFNRIKHHINFLKTHRKLNTIQKELCDSILS